MYSISLRRADHVRHYSIATFESGWEVKLQQDNEVQRLMNSRDPNAESREPLKALADSQELIADS